MSLTETENVFAGIREDALNDLITAFCTDRPRYLAYGSPAFVPVTTAAETSMPAIAFPGVPGGIQWRVTLSIPHVDLFKQSSPLPPQLTLQAHQFSLHVGVELCVDCRRLRIDPRPPRASTDTNQPPPDQKVGEGHLTCCRLDVFAIGHLEHVLAGNGEDAIALAADAVEIVDITPDALESVLECLLLMILQAVLSGIRLPLRALRVGAFELVVTQGPLIDDNEIKARGTF